MGSKSINLLGVRPPTQIQQVGEVGNTWTTQATHGPTKMASNTFCYIHQTQSPF